MTRGEMTAKSILVAVLLLLGSNGSNAQPSRADSLKFMGRAVTITERELDADGSFPLGPASICVEGPPQRQCYTALEAFRGKPRATVVKLANDASALLFSVESYGVSGWEIHFALLRPGTGKNLENLFPHRSVPNQSQHAFWHDSTISGAPIFLTAEYVWGPDESHYGEHRYMISVYARSTSMADDLYHDYYLEDRYMTVRKYALEKADVLASEKQEILARLRRRKAETIIERSRRVV